MESICCFDWVSRAYLACRERRFVQLLFLGFQQLLCADEFSVPVQVCDWTDAHMRVRVDLAQRVQQVLRLGLPRGGLCFLPVQQVLLELQLLDFVLQSCQLEDFLLLVVRLVFR